MTEQTSSEVTGNTRWGVTALAILSGVIAATQIGKVPPSMSLLGTEFAIGMVALGLDCVNIQCDGCGPWTSLFGALSDGFGHRRVLVLSLWTIAAGSLLGAFTDSYTLLFATRIIEGVGYLGVIVAAPSLIVEATNPKDFGLALGLWSSFLPFGFAMMMVTSPWLLEASGWQGLWLFNAAILAIFALIFTISTRGSIVTAQSTAGAADAAPGASVSRYWARRGRGYWYSH